MVVASKNYWDLWQGCSKLRVVGRGSVGGELWVGGFALWW